MLDRDVVERSQAHTRGRASRSWDMCVQRSLRSCIRFRVERSPSRDTSEASPVDCAGVLTRFRLG